ncbi:MAG: hypothetical protein ACFFD2_00675 [Promethearchaeota archaeon]
MFQKTVFKGERPLKALGKEIIEKKTEAFESALASLVPVKILIYPYVKDYRRKLTKQRHLLIRTAKKIIQNPEDQEKYIKKSALQYYRDDPFYALIMLYIPNLIVPMHIQKLLKNFQRRTKRIFKRRVLDIATFLQYIQESEISEEAPDREFFQYIFPKDKLFTAYLRATYDNDKKTLQMLKKGANWRNFYTIDILNSFSITFIPLYRLFSRIWKRISETMNEYIKTKVLDYYLVDTLSEHVYNILKEKSYSYLLDEVFPVPPEIVMKDMHNPEFIMRFNPQKGLQVTKCGTNCERYNAIANIILFKLKIKWDTHYRFKGDIEEWWITNSNYVKTLTGFCVYERTEENYCHFYNITVNVEPAENLEALGAIIIPTLERITKDNTKLMMDNVKKYYYTQISS